MRHKHHAGIVGMYEYIGHGGDAVIFVIESVDFILIHFDRAIAVERGVGRDFTGINGRGHGDRFEHRTGLIRKGYGFELIDFGADRVGVFVVFVFFRVVKNFDTHVRIFAYI